MNHLFYIAILLLGGLIFSRLFEIMKFPEVTGYLIAGIVLGPSVLGLIPKMEVETMEIMSQVALSFIAFSIGNQMKLNQLRKMGSKIVLVTVFEALGAFVVITLGTRFLFNTSFAFAITLGSIACATAPAATLMVIKQYKAKGELVDVLIPVVALDDAVCIITFGIASSVAVALLQGGELHVLEMIFQPIKEILFAIGIGLITGVIAAFASKKARNDDELITVMLALIFIATSLALYFELSSLLTLMVAGVLLANLHNTHRRYQQLIEKITPPIFVLFFVLAGADLNLKSLTQVGGLGIFYIIARILGKSLGAYTSTRISGFSESVQRYLGLTLMPQAGVAIGLSLIANRIIPSPNGALIRTIILGATIFYELIGPLAAKFALTKAGCINKDEIEKSE